MTEDILGEHLMEKIFWQMKYDLKRDILFCNQLPSLWYLELSKISINFWRDQLSIVDLRQLHDQNIHDKLKIYEKNIKGKILNLTIPINDKVALKKISNSLMVNIASFLKEQDPFIYFTSLDTFRIYWDNICFSEQGTINFVQTATQLIENTPLSVIDKYILACDNCLEAKIKILLELLPENFIEEFENYIERYCLVMFWTFYIRGELERFSAHIQGNDTWDYILRWAINNKKEVAVQYIWENFANEQMKKDIADYIDFNNKSSFSRNICLYFFLQMDEIQAKNMDVNTSLLLLEKLHIISMWCEVTPAVKYIPAIIRKFNVFDAFKIIIFCWQLKIINLNQYTYFWNELTFRFILDIKENFIKIWDDIIYYCLFKGNDILTLKLLIKISTPENKIKILNREDGWNNGVEYCAKLITVGGPDLSDIFINHILENKVKISKFRKELFEYESLDICAEMIVNCKYEWISKFLNKFCDKDLTHIFKKELPLKNKADILRYISMRAAFHKVDLLTALNHFLIWNFEGNGNEIDKYKSIVYDVDADLYSDKRRFYFKTINELVLDRNWDMVENYWKWIFLASKKRKIKTIKKKLKRIKKILFLTSLNTCTNLSMTFIACNDLLRRIITSCLTLKEAEELKEQLRGKDYLVNLVGILLELQEHQKANDLTEWCYSSVKSEISKFKIFFMHSRGYSMLFNLVNNSNNEEIECLIKWFNPSRAALNLFKDSFISFVNKEESQNQKSKHNKQSKTEFNEHWSALHKRVKICLEFL